METTARRIYTVMSKSFSATEHISNLNMRVITFLLFVFWNINTFGCDLLGTDARFRTRRASNNTRDANQRWNSTWTDKLKKDLLLSYDKFSRPAEPDRKITVKTDFVIRHIELDEQKSTMTLYSWLRMVWTDDKLKWNPNDYGGMSELHLADHEIWQPDIYPYNGVTGGVSDYFENTNCIAYQNGSVLWVPPSVFQVFCQMDLTYWPFDTQTCSLVLGSWTYSGEQVDLQFLHPLDELNNVLIKNSEWDVVKVDKERHSVYYPCCPDAYIDVTYDITVRRRSPTYIALLATPATAIIIMALSVFLIPPLSTDKITLGGTAIIVTSLFLLYFTHKLPMMAGHTPLIVMFYSRTLYLLSFSLIISVIVINLAKNPKFSPLPWSIKRLLTGCLGKCLLINTLGFKGNSKPAPSSSFKTDEGVDSLPVLSEQEKHNEECGNYEMFQRDWILFAVAIDRITFLVYSFIFVILAITYSV